MDKNEQKKAFAKNLKNVMKEKGYSATATQLEKIFNLKYYGKAISPHGVARWLRGETLPSYDKMITLAELLDVEPDELCPGFKTKEKTTKQKKKSQDNIGYQEREVFEAFLNLPAPQKKVIREVILAFSRAYSG